LEFQVIGLAACSSATPTSSLMPTDNHVPAALSTPAPTSTSTSTPAAIPTANPEPTPIGGGGHLVFTWDSFEHIAEEMSYARIIKFPDQIGYTREDYPGLSGNTNVFISDADGTNAVPLTTDGLDGNISLGDVSPDGKKIVAYSYNSTVSDLFVIDLTGAQSEPRKITGIGYGKPPKWIDNEHIVFSGMVDGVDGIYLADLNGSAPSLLTKGKDQLDILAVRNGGVYWDKYKVNYTLMDQFPTGSGIWWSSLDGTVQKQIVKFDEDFLGYSGVSPDGAMVVWPSFRDVGVINISLLDDINNVVSFHRPDITLLPTWSPDYSKIYFKGGLPEPTDAYILDLKTCAFISLPPLPTRDDGLLETFGYPTWSPDSQRLILNNGLEDGDWTVTRINRIFDLARNTYLATLPETATYFMVWVPDPDQPMTNPNPASGKTTLPCANR
jgi:hypothetical protein